jgi:hypothetical protein
MLIRVFSKQSNKIFGSNRNKPKLNLFRFIFGLFRETKKLLFRFVSVFLTYFETTETNRSVSKKNKKATYKLGCPRNKQKNFPFEPKQTETRPVLVDFRFVSQNQKINFSVRFGVLIESLSKQPKEPKQTDQFRNKSKKTHKTRAFRGKNLIILDTELLHFKFFVIFWQFYGRVVKICTCFLFFGLFRFGFFFFG